MDGTAGPYSNTTVLFLGSNDGIVLKVLPSRGQSEGQEPILLEEIDAYSPARYEALVQQAPAQQGWDGGWDRSSNIGFCTAESMERREGLWREAGQCGGAGWSLRNPSPMSCTQLLVRLPSSIL